MRVFLECAGLALVCGALLAPNAVAQPRCDQSSVTAGALRTLEDVRAFVQCAKEYVEENGHEEAYRAFQEDERWKVGPTYVFVSAIAEGGKSSLALVCPGCQSIEGRTYAPLVDQFGSDYFREEIRLLNNFGGGWIYYSFLNPATGISEPKVSYLVQIDWNGTPAYLGAGIYRHDIPGTCAEQDVNASGVERAASPERLQEFVRCAAFVFETKGYFASTELSAHPRWSEGSVYVFGLELTGSQFFTGNPVRERGREMSEWGTASSPADLFEGRDVISAAAVFGEMFLYYTTFNPANGRNERKVAFLKRTDAHGAPVLIGSGYYLEGASE